ncbi:hypothetical protein [Pedobacter insulae]|uniref:Uncharacterized protein n=1 Tax=Pedobacter insulae TaxID=414048 RepID=A0A1I2WNH1_9SPHI|nr:hypothetical protein [Pedobacter insulae]SFH01131.1 hypothetical protein SAMN04489864_10478 [Pedobacter insulae]
MKLLIQKITLLKAIFFALLLLTSLNLFAQVPGKIHVGFIYPLSSNGTHAPLDTNNFSIHLIAGVSAAERGLTFAGLSNFVRHDAVGSQFAGFSNHIGGKADGTQFAGFANTYRGGKGAAFAGFTNIANGNVKGAQFSGFANIAHHIKGAQFAGFINLAHSIKGAQFAGFANITSQNVSESQLAGFINIAKKVKGAQIAGFINIADSSDYPIGIINIVKNGEKSIGVTIDETQTTMLSFRSGGKALYGIIGVGYNHQNEDEVYAAEVGLGAHFFSSNAFSLNTELVATTLESFKAGEYFKTSFRVMPNVKLFKTLGVFGGPSINYVTTNTDEGKQLYTKNLKTWNNKWGNDYNALYVGYTAGLQILF